MCLVYLKNKTYMTEIQWKRWHRTVKRKEQKHWWRHKHTSSHTGKNAWLGVLIETYKVFEAGFTHGPLKKLCRLGPVTLYCLAAVWPWLLHWEDSVSLSLSHWAKPPLTPQRENCKIQVLNTSFNAFSRCRLFTAWWVWENDVQFDKQTHSTTFSRVVLNCVFSCFVMKEQ